jgi:hypothetical protein
MDEPNNILSGPIKAKFTNHSAPIVQFIDATFAYPSKPSV